MNLPLFSHIYTVADKAYLLEKLAALEAGVFSTKKGYEEQVHDQFSLVLAESLLQTATELRISTNTPESIQKFLQELQEDIKKLPQITIRIAIHPTDDLLRSVSKYFDSIMGEKIVVSYIVDGTLLGGIVIEWNGQYLDYSLKKRLHSALHMENLV